MASKYKRKKLKNGSCLARGRKSKGDDFKNRSSENGEPHKKRISLLRYTVEGSHVYYVLFILLLTPCFCQGYKEQRFAMEPQDQSAIIGSRVTLPCRVEGKAGTLQWTKDDFGLGTHRNLSGYDRYSMIGSNEEGDYSLDIRELTLEDDGVFQCQVSSGPDGEPPIRSRYAKLTVLVAPEPPRIVQGGFIDATEDRPVELECISVGGKPAAEITWLDGNQAVITKGVTTIRQPLDDGQRITTRSLMKLVPKNEDHNQTFTCQAQNTADRTYRSDTIHMEVKYAPKVHVFLKSGAIDGKIPEGAEVIIGCEVDANPASVSFRWYLDDRPVIGDYTTEMILFNVTRKNNDAIVKCEVDNAVGKSEETETLEVTYPPSFRTQPKNVEAESGSQVTLICEVDGNPSPQIRWILYEPGRIGQVKGKISPLKIVVSNETAGRYLCKASIEGYPDIETEATVFIKGPPKILSNLTQFGFEGDSVRVECATLSVPKPDDIRWYFEGKEISVVHDQDYATLEETLPDGVIKSSLVIRSSQTRHFGVYNCSVTNEYGNVNAAIKLKPTKTLPLLLMLVGVLSGIVVFAAFVLLLVLCHRRRRKYNKPINEKPDVTVTSADLYKESDRSSNISDLKLQLHVGDGGYDMDYSNTGSDNTIMSNLKIGAGLPLAGPVPLPTIRHDDQLMHFRYSNDYSDPAFNESYYKVNGLNGYLSYGDFAQDYNHSMRSSHLEPPASNRSLQGSLTRSIDTASTVQLTGSVSQNNSLQRSVGKGKDEIDALNSLGLPSVENESVPPLYSQPLSKSNSQVASSILPSGIDMRYSATYGNPYLKTGSSLGFGNQVNTAKPASTPAPPPYSSVRSSVVLPSGGGNGPSQATHV